MMSVIAAWWPTVVTDIVHLDWRALTTLRVAIVLILAALAVRGLRHAAAAHRHGVWICALVLCALVSAVGAWTTTREQETVSGILGLWLLGAAVVGVRTLRGLQVARRLSKEANRLSGSQWLEDLAAACAQVGARTPVELGSHPELQTPITFGYRRPVVLLPRLCDTWTPEARRAVLLHEVAHVRRRDWLAQLLDRVLCTLYWFHPLVWWAVARRRLEAERACDETVVRHGVPPRMYAALLLSAASGPDAYAFRTGSPLTRPAARELEARLRAILAPSPSFSMRRTYATIATFMLLSAAIGSVALTAPAPVCAMTQAARLSSAAAIDASRR